MINNEISVDSLIALQIFLSSVNRIVEVEVFHQHRSLFDILKCHPLSMFFYTVAHV